LREIDTRIAVGRLERCALPGGRERKVFAIRAMGTIELRVVNCGTGLAYRPVPTEKGA